MTRSRKSSVLLLVFAVVAGLAVWQGFARVGARAQMQETVGVQSKDAELVAVTFASAWCGPCKILQPRLTAVRSEFTREPVRFLTLDYTLGEQDSFEVTAEAEGFGEAYKRFTGATGFTVLIDRQTGDVLDVLTADYSKTAMKQALRRALALSTQ